MKARHKETTTELLLKLDEICFNISDVMKNINCLNDLYNIFLLTIIKFNFV